MGATPPARSDSRRILKKAYGRHCTPRSASAAATSSEVRQNHNSKMTKVPPQQDSRKTNRPLPQQNNGEPPQKKPAVQFFAKYRQSERYAGIKCCTQLFVHRLGVRHAARPKCEAFSRLSNQHAQAVFNANSPGFFRQLHEGRRQSRIRQIHRKRAFGEDAIWNSRGRPGECGTRRIDDDVEFLADQIHETARRTAERRTSGVRSLRSTVGDIDTRTPFFLKSCVPASW